MIPFNSSTIGVTRELKKYTTCPCLTGRTQLTSIVTVYPLGTAIEISTVQVCVDDGEGLSVNVTR